MSRIIFTFESLNFLHWLCYTLTTLCIAASKLFLPFVHFPRNIFLVVQLPVKTCFLWTLFPWTLHFVDLINLEPTSVPSSLWHSRVMLLPFFRVPSGHTVKRSQLSCPYLLCLLVFLWSGKFVLIRLIFMISGISWVG